MVKDLSKTYTIISTREKIYYELNTHKINTLYLSTKTDYNTIAIDLQAIGVRNNFEFKSHFNKMYIILIKFNNFI